VGVFFLWCCFCFLLCVYVGGGGGERWEQQGNGKYVPTNLWGYQLVETKAHHQPQRPTNPPPLPAREWWRECAPFLFPLAAAEAEEEEARSPTCHRIFLMISFPFVRFKYRMRSCVCVCVCV
jgi:hypothetical protein